METEEKNCKLKFDSVWIWLLLVGLLVTFNPCGILSNTVINWVCFILGTGGFLYCLHHAAIWLVRPIKRDWMLMHENLLLRVICFALSVPFIFTSGIVIHECIHEKEGTTKAEFVFGSNMYVQQLDTIEIDKSKIDWVLNYLVQMQLSQASIDSSAIDSEKERLMLQLKKQAKIAGWTEGEKEGLFIKKVDKVPDNIESEEDEPHLFWTVYYHFIDAGNQHMASSRNGRGWVALIAILGVLLLNGLLVSTLINYFDRRKERWQKGEVRYRLRSLGKNRFAVIIGGNEIATTVVKNLLTGKKTPDDINFKCEGDNKYVILQTCRDPQTVRDELSAHLPEKMMKNVIIYKALRNSKEELKKLYLDYTTEIYVLGESVTNGGGETYHDALNMECVNLMAKILEQTRKKRIKEKKGKTSGRKVCKVMFEYQTTFSIFQFSDISKTVGDNLVFIPFNRYESWAREVIVNSENYTPLDGEKGFGENSDDYVHFIVVGMSKMGIAMGTQAMLQAHYLNSKKKKTRITFIDTHADKEMAFFKGRYSNLFELTRHRFVDCAKVYSSDEEREEVEKWIDPIEDGSKWKHLSDDGKNFIDIEIEFVKGELESDGVREFLCQATEQEGAKVTIAICLSQTHQAIAAALYLPIEIYKSNRLQEVWVYQSESADIIDNLRDDDSNQDLRYKKLRPFGMVLGEYMSDRSQYLKAMLANAAYDININEKYTWPEDITDNDSNYAKIKEAWKELSVGQKWSHKYFVDSIYQKIKSAMCNEDKDAKYILLRYQIKNKDLNSSLVIKEALKQKEKQLAICEHNRWNVQQLLLGYSACDKQLNHILDLKEAGCDFMQKYVKWAKENLGIEIDPSKKIDPKKEAKNSKLRIHPNICDYAHLNKIDSGAQKYDSELNNAIPTILDLVDIRPQRK